MAAVHARRQHRQQALWIQVPRQHRALGQQPVRVRVTEHELAQSDRPSVGVVRAGGELGHVRLGDAVPEAERLHLAAAVGLARVEQRDTRRGGPVVDVVHGRDEEIDARSVRDHQQVDAVLVGPTPPPVLRGVAQEAAAAGAGDAGQELVGEPVGDHRRHPEPTQSGGGQRDLGGHGSLPFGGRRHVVDRAGQEPPSVRARRQVVERIPGVRQGAQCRAQQGLQVVEVEAAHSRANHWAARASSRGLASPRRITALARMLAIVRVGCAA